MSSRSGILPIEHIEVKSFLESKSSMSKAQVLKESVTTEKRSETLSLTATPAVRNEIESIAKAEDRSISWVVLALMERGLEAYKKDGSLRPAHNTKLRKAG